MTTASLTYVANPGLTLTGADELTDWRDLQRLLVRCLGLEIGLLFTRSPDGRNRYPSDRWLRETVGRFGQRCAVHVCGRQAREEVLSYQHPWLHEAGRIQINGSLTEEEVRRAAGLFGKLITQHNGHGPDHSRLPVFGHSLLVDASGGRGKLPREWVRPITDKPVGFAGGLGPHNLAAELPRIAAVASGTWWVDMESSLRDGDDWFSLELAHTAVDRFLEARQ